MFCKYCGKELKDEAVVCTGCGCLAEKEVNAATAPVAIAPIELVMSEEELAKKAEEERVTKLESHTKKAVTFSVLSFSFICATVFALCAQLNDFLYSIISSYGGYSSDGMAIALVFSFVALGMGITAFVFGRKIKKEKTGVALITTFLFIASIFAVVIPFFFLTY